MRILTFVVCFLAIPTASFADFQVFGVRTDFAMGDNETPARDVYVNIGTSQGIKVGSQLEAFRALTTVDEINQKIGRNISFKIARLKVIHADSDIAVARVVQMQPAESTPVGSYTNVMVGDVVQVISK